MKQPPPKTTDISEWVEKNCDAETRYRFYERSGMGLDEGLTVSESDRKAYRDVFGYDWQG